MLLEALIVAVGLAALLRRHFLPALRDALAREARRAPTATRQAIRATAWRVARDSPRTALAGRTLVRWRLEMLERLEATNDRQAQEELGVLEQLGRQILGAQRLHVGDFRRRLGGGRRLLRLGLARSRASGLCAAGAAAPPRRACSVRPFPTEGVAPCTAIARPRRGRPPPRARAPPSASGDRRRRARDRRRLGGDATARSRRRSRRSARSAAAPDPTLHGRQALDLAPARRGRSRRGRRSGGVRRSASSPSRYATSSLLICSQVNVLIETPPALSAWSRWRGRPSS